MALIKCSKCGCDVSDKARECPNCGNLQHTEKIKEKSKKIIFMLSIMCSIFIFLFFLIFLIETIVGITKLNYPLTSVIPIIVSIITIVVSIMLFIIMFRWKQNKKTKKLFKLFLIFIVVDVFIFFISSPINRVIQKNNIGYKEQGYSTYSIKGISYDISNKWRTESAKNGYYHYPYVDNEDGVLYVYSKYFNEFTNNYNDINEYYKDFVDGFKKSESYIKIISEQTFKINNKDAYKVNYRTIINDIYYDGEIYIYLDVDAKTIYAFSFNIKDSISSSIRNDIGKIINSIRER